MTSRSSYNDHFLPIFLWHNFFYFVGLHVVEKLGEVQRGYVSLQGPGGIGVADDECHVGDVVDHDAVVDDVLVCLVLLPVDGHLYSTLPDGKN